MLTAILLASAILARPVPQEAAAPPEPAPSGFAVEVLAPGVWALLRREPPGLWFEANNVLIELGEGVVVVDANLGLQATREVLAELRRLTPRPVTHVINTHWHEDHVLGNGVWREAFPQARFVGHASTARDFGETGRANRAAALRDGPGFADFLQGLLDSGTSLAGGVLDGEERAGLAATLALVRAYVADVPGAPEVLPTLEVDERLVLQGGGRTLEVRHLGAGHTAADLVVHLPAERILVTGDLVVCPVPLVGSTSFPRAWAGTLARALELEHAVLVPGHGPLLRDDAHARATVELLASLSGQVAAAAEAGLDLEATRRAVDLAPFRERFAGGSVLRGLIFDEYVAGSGVAAAHAEWRAAAGR